MNTLHFQEDAKGGRSLNFRFTDAAMATVGQTAMYALESRIVARDGRFQSRPRTAQQLSLLPDPEPDEATIVAAQGTRDEAHTEVRSLSATSFEQMSREVWHCDGTGFKLDEPRLKAEGKLDYGKRVSLTLIYAHELEGKGACTRELLSSTLDKQSVNDPHVRTFLRTYAGFDREQDGGLFRLNKQGRDAAKDALKRIFDDSVTGPGWLPDGRGGKSKETDEKDATSKSAGKKGRKPSTKPNEWARKWKVSHPSVDGHSLLVKRGNAEKGMFGLWAISKVADEAGKIVSELMLSKFLLEAFIFQIDTRTLARALQSDRCKGKVIKVAGGFQLQPPGAKWASDVAAGKSSI
jgi:hypothetical protein